MAPLETLLARAVVAALQTTSKSYPLLLYTNTLERVLEMFAYAKEHKPCVIFMIDTIG